MTCGECIEAGWLPRRAAARALAVSVSELDRLVRVRELRVKRAGPLWHQYLVEVWS